MLGPRQHLQAVSVGRDSLLDRIRDPSLTVLLILEVSIIFLTAPLAAKGLPIDDMMVDIVTWAMVVIIVLLAERCGAIISMVVAVRLSSARRSTPLPGGSRTLRRSLVNSTSRLRSHA